MPQGGEPGEDLWYDPLAGSMAAKLAQLEEEAKRAEEAEHEKQRLRMLELERQALANESKADKVHKDRLVLLRAKAASVRMRLCEQCSLRENQVWPRTSR